MSVIYNFFETTGSWDGWDVSDGNWSVVSDILTFTDVAATGGCGVDDDELIQGEKYKLSIRFQAHTEVEGYSLTCKLRNSTGSIVKGHDSITNNEIYTADLTAGSGATDITITDSNSQAGNTAEFNLVKVETIAASLSTTPVPANGAVDVSTVLAELAWTNGATNVAKTKLYFRKVGDAWGSAVQDLGSAETSYTLTAGLDYGQKYEWRVDTLNGHGEITTGTTWNFTTKKAPRDRGRYYGSYRQRYN